MIEDQTTPRTIESYVVSAGRRQGWTVKVGDDLPVDVYYDENVTETALLRVHFRISRSPSKRRYLLRHFRDATDADRAEAMKYFPGLPEMFDRCEAEGAAGRRLDRTDRTWFFTIRMGTPIEDPLIQLELEMMIDLTSRQEAAA